MPLPRDEVLRAPDPPLDPLEALRAPLRELPLLRPDAEPELLRALALEDVRPPLPEDLRAPLPEDLRAPLPEALRALRPDELLLALELLRAPGLDARLRLDVPRDCADPDELVSAAGAEPLPLPELSAPLFERLDFRRVDSR